MKNEGRILTVKGTHPTGEELIQAMERTGQTFLLSFSLGKDAVALWLKLRGRVPVIPFYYYGIPGLSFIERSIRYYEDFFGQKIVQVPSPGLYRRLRNFAFQPPERCPRIEWLKLPIFDKDDLHRVIAADQGLPAGTWTATGVREADSTNRRAVLRRYGPVNRERHMLCPIWDMRMEGLVNLLLEAKVKLPVDYKLFGRSFDGVHYFYLSKIREHFPDDYAKILEWFPFAELEMKRVEYGQN